MFDFTENYTLEDERVLLRPLQIEDVANLLPFALQEPDIWRYSLATIIDEATLRAYIQKALQGRQDAKDYPFIVFDKLAGKYAGSTCFYDVQLSHQTLLLGYTWYGKAFQGTGLNTHCKFLLLQFAFEQVHMERVEFRADVNNARSIKAMENIGCKREGVLRSNFRKGEEQTRRDSIVLSILKQEWETEVKDLLLKRLNENKK